MWLLQKKKPTQLPAERKTKGTNLHKLHLKHLLVGKMKVNQGLLPLNCHTPTSLLHPGCWMAKLPHGNALPFARQGCDQPWEEKAHGCAPSCASSQGTPQGKENPALPAFSFRAVLRPCSMAVDTLRSGFSAGEDGHIAPAVLNECWIWGEKELGGSWSTYWPVQNTFLQQA